MHATMNIESTGLFSAVEPYPRLNESTPEPPRGHPGARRVLHRGQHLFRSGDQVTHVYRVSSGVLKSYLIHQDGDEQIIGFHLLGDLIGCDALAGGSSAFSVVALDTASVTPVTIDTPGFHSPFNSELDHQIHSYMRTEIFRLARLLHLERSGPDARLARFLLDYAAAQSCRGYNRSEFHLPMGRKDLACYIGLAPETVSRIFSRLRDRGILSVENNHIRILDHAALRDVM